MIGNAYLEALTSEKVYIIAGPEFKELEEHILVISKALFGIRSSCAKWHKRFADYITEVVSSSYENQNWFLPIKIKPRYLDASIRRHI